MIDTLLFNARIATLDPAKPSATAAAIENDMFAALGDDQDIRSPREPADGPRVPVTVLARSVKRLPIERSHPRYGQVPGTIALTDAPPLPSAACGV